MWLIPSSLITATKLTAAAARVVVPAAAAEASSLVVRSWTVYTGGLVDRTELAAPPRCADTVPDPIPIPPGRPYH